MADNLSIKDGAGATRTVAATDVSTVHVPRHILVNQSNTFVDVGGKLDTLAGYLDGVEGYTNGTQIEAAAINTVLGVKADAKSTATDTTSISAMSVWKQISASVQALVTGTVLAAGSALIGRAVADASAATGGIASCARLASSAASTNATNAKASAGRLYSVQIRNVATYDVYLVLYDTAGTPTPGTTTIRKKIPIPALSMAVLDWPLGLYFGSGIAYAITKLAADADTTAVAAGDVLQLNLDYV